MAPRVFYIAPDNPRPSWGVALLYGHVSLLREAGTEAFVVHEKPRFHLDWVDFDGPVVTQKRRHFQPNDEDILVVPEVLAGSSRLHGLKGRLILFVQGGALLLKNVAGPKCFLTKGFEQAMTTMPHLAAVVERFTGLSASIIPPYIASYFFEPRRPHPKRLIVFVTKTDYRIAGYPDADIFEKIVRPHLASHPEWELRELTGYTHRETADLMRSAEILVNLNCLEAFNATVPEAMAAGCVPFCYEAVGGADFLVDGENAVVVANNHVYELVERLMGFVDGSLDRTKTLERLRVGGRATARRYTRDRTAAALTGFFAGLTSGES